MPTMPCTATEREETSSETNFKEDDSWLFDQIDISVPKNLVKTITKGLRLCSLNTRTLSAKLIWI